MGLLKQGEQFFDTIRTRVARSLAPMRRVAGRALHWLVTRVEPAWLAIGRFFALRAVQVGLHVTSVLALLAVLAAYGRVWLEFNTPMLTDVDLQSDDARTAVFPFHRYASDPALQDDPIAQEMLSFVPPGVWLLYRVLVPFTDVFIAPKIVQGLAYLVVLIAGWILWRSRRTGLGAGVLLVFFVCHDWYAIERIAGGLGRAFGFPCFALWLAGVLAHNRRARFAAPALAALTYPSAMVLLFAAEGLYVVRGLFGQPRAVVLRRLLRYAKLVAVCVLLVLPSALGSEERGPVHSLEQARLEPAFTRAGRLWILPFAEPTKVFLPTYIDQLMPRGDSPVPELKRAYEANAEVWATTFIALLILVGFLRLGPRPAPAVAFTCGAVILYLLSCVLAFQLYSPERYYSYGMRMAAIALLVGVPARLLCMLPRRPRAIANNFIAAGLILLVWFCAGHGQKAPSGMFISAARDRSLHEFVRTLPKDVRIASHPMDGDGIPYFGARATMGTFETLQPWFVDSWRRQKQRTEATLRALYATERKDVLSYAKERNVTHILLNRQRYRSNFVARSASFQPFTAYARAILAQRRLKDLVLADVPDSAIVFRDNQWQLVSVAKLRDAWR